MQTVLTLNLGGTVPQAIAQLQNIKDAMCQAIFLKIEATGIQDSQDPLFSICQSIYLEADHRASTLLQPS